VKHGFYGPALPALVVATVPALDLASSLGVHAAGSASQTVFMCPDCNQPIACAKAGDYTLAFAADIDHPKNGGTVRFHVRVTERNGAPVTNARPSVTLSMEGHAHQPRALPFRGGRAGHYTAVTTFRPIDIQGPWKADVQIKSAKGDRVSQSFTFNR
jgi:hypothetical protein